MELQAPDWLNVEFMQTLLRKSKNDETLEVNDLTTKPATSVGDNYTSDMIRASVGYSRIKSGRKVAEKISLIVKIAPTTDSTRKELAGLFDIEIRMMDGPLKKMNEMLSAENHRLSANCLYTEKTNRTLLVIEDLAPLGFRMADRQAALDLPHCIIAMQGLARFHATSVALQEKEPKLIKSFNKGMCHKDQPEVIKQFFGNGIKALATEVAKWTELGTGYSEKIMALAETAYARGIEISKLKEDEFNVLTHGDFWINNMLFRYNDVGKPIDHIFVDFQLCTWTTPAVDILYFMNTSPSDEVLYHHRDTILEEYLNTLTSLMKRLGCKTKPPSMATLENTLKERQFYGIIAACAVLPLVLIDKSDAKSLDEIMNEGGEYDNPAYRGRLYRKTMLRRLHEWNAKGLLDV